MVIFSETLTETNTIKKLKLYTEKWYVIEKVQVMVECYISLER